MPGHARGTRFTGYNTPKLGEVKLSPKMKRRLRRKRRRVTRKGY